MGAAFFDVDTERLQLRCWGSRNPLLARQVDVWTRDARRFYVGRFASLPHTSRRQWHYPEPGGASSGLDPGLRAWLRRTLAAAPETALLAATVPVEGGV